MSAAMLYVQADGKPHADGSVTGNLVLVDPSGEKHTYHFTSSGKSESRGPLPGLVSEKNLRPHGEDPLKPHAVYKIGPRLPSSRFITSDHDRDFGFFYPIQCDSVVRRGSFGIHPSGGDGTTTLGCLGLDDESARRFLADMKNLGTEAPGQLEVYGVDQDVAAIQTARQKNATAIVASGTQNRAFKTLRRPGT
jgi:hypothetical protein